MAYSPISYRYFQVKDNETYRINIHGNILILRTTSFKAEKGSVLHSGIFNRELASALSAGTILGLIGFLLALNFKITAIHFIIAVFLFGALFLILRSFIFKEPVFETVLDKERGIIALSQKKALGENREIYPISELADIRMDKITVKPENPDGIRVVENVALQHGTVIPGFGEPEEFYVVELEFRGGRRAVVFSSKEGSESEEVASGLKGFIKG
jgi:hypothetical protein